MTSSTEMFSPFNTGTLKCKACFSCTSCPLGLRNAIPRSLLSVSAVFIDGPRQSAYMHAYCSERDSVTVLLVA